MKFRLMTAVALGGVLAASLPANAQPVTSVTAEQKYQSASGSFSIDFRSRKVSQQQLEQALPGLLGMGKQTSFKELTKKTGQSGLTHIAYQQYFKGIPVQDGMVLVHLKDGLVSSANGVALSIPDDFPMPAQRITADEALAKAQKFMGVKNLIGTYPAELVMMRNKAGAGNAFVLAWKVRVDGKKQDGDISMKRVFISADAGSLINSMSLITDADVTANAETIYRGQKQITADSYNGKFRLRDNARKIETYNASGQDQLWSSSGPFQERIDYFDDDTQWGEVKVLSSYKMTSTGSSAILNGIGVVGTTNALVNAVGHVNPDAMLTANIPLIQSSNLPIEISGINTELPDQNCYGSFWKIDVQNNNFSLLDSLNFPLSDTSIGTHTWTNPNGATGTYTMSMAKNPALDAHWGMEKTHDFYLQVFNRNSYDDSGSVVRNYINGAFSFQGTQDNAAALPEPFNAMVYGLGDGAFMGPVVGLDVMGHEFTHMVTAHNGYGGLNYQGEPGALNESFSDMMGTAIEFFTDSTNANWTIGEGITLVAPYYFRSMSEPKGPASGGAIFTRQPDTYHGEYWFTGQTDDGGVHVNSGVPNKWFYLLSEGGSGTNDNNYQYQVAGLGMARAEDIAYTTFTEYLTPSASLVDAYYGSLDMATDKYGANSPEYTAVQHAWWAVGVPNNADSTMSVATVKDHSDYVSIYPNPARNTVTISSTWQQPLEMVIYSITGAKVQTIQVPSGQKNVDISGLSKGTYFVKYEVNHQRFAEKLTII